MIGNDLSNLEWMAKLKKLKYNNSDNIYSQDDIKDSIFISIKKGKAKRKVNIAHIESIYNLTKSESKDILIY